MDIYKKIIDYDDHKALILTKISLRSGRSALAVTFM